MKCKTCGKDRGHNNPLISRCKTCQYEYASNNKKQTRINLVSNKKKERLQKGGSEAELFKEIWNEREHKCNECGKYLKEAKVHNFSHIKSKGSRPDLRLDKTNIELLCFRCHFKKDMGLDYKGPDLD